MRYLFIFIIIGSFFAIENAMAQGSIKIGFTAVVLRENLALNRRLIKYIEKRIGTEVLAVYRKSYKEIDDLLEFREIEIAWICGVPYAAGHKKFGLDLLVVPTLKGEPTYYSLVVVPIDSQAKKLADLRSKKYAFSDPLSNSGKVAPTYSLAKMGTNPRTFFKKFIYTYSHYESIQAVAEKFVDGASVDSYVYEAALRFSPAMVSKTKVVEKFGPYGFTPLVIRSDIDSVLKKKLQRIFTGMKNDDEGKKILEAYGFESFIVPSDSLYDNIREMMRFLKIY